jgi:hypothetical protein
LAAFPRLADRRKRKCGSTANRGAWDQQRAEQRQHRQDARRVRTGIARPLCHFRNCRKVQLQSAKVTAVAKLRGRMECMLRCRMVRRARGPCIPVRSRLSGWPPTQTRTRRSSQEAGKEPQERLQLVCKDAREAESGTHPSRRANVASVKVDPVLPHRPCEPAACCFCPLLLIEGLRGS